jgi:uncharacterized OB-fold protein
MTDAPATRPATAGAPAPKRIEPVGSPLTEPFWTATREHRLLLQWCLDCDRVVFYPREACPGCLGTDLDWRPAAGTGTVYAVSVQHRAGPGRDEADGPYAVALVDLPEGARLMTNVVGVAPETVTVGQAVRVHWHPLDDGRNLPFFTPAP